MACKSYPVFGFGLTIIFLNLYILYFSLFQTYCPYFITCSSPLLWGHLTTTTTTTTTCTHVHVLPETFSFYFALIVVQKGHQYPESKNFALRRPLWHASQRDLAKTSMILARRLWCCTWYTKTMSFVLSCGLESILQCVCFSISCVNHVLCDLMWDYTVYTQV